MLPWWFTWSCICLQSGRLEFDPWVRKIPWKRGWLPTPVFLPIEIPEQRGLVGFSPWNLKELDMPEWPTHICIHRFIHCIIDLLEPKSRQSSDLGSDSGREPLRMVQAWSLQWPILGPWGSTLLHLPPFLSSLVPCVIVSYVSLPLTQFLYTEGWYFIFTNVLPIPLSCTKYQAMHNGYFIHLLAPSRSATPQSCLETSQVNP